MLFTERNYTSIEGVSRPNAFQVLMSSSKRTVLPPHIEHRSNSAAARGDHAIYITSFLMSLKGLI